MGGFGIVMGNLAGGFEEARQRDLQRQFEDEQNRRSQIAGFLQKIAMDENAHPYSRQQAVNEYLNMAQTPHGKKYKFNPDTLIAPANTQQAATFTPPPTPPMQLGNISLPPAPPQTATLAPEPGIFKTHEQLETEAAGGARRMTEATAGGEMKSSAFQYDPVTGRMRQVAISGTGQPIGTPIENAISPYMLQGRGESNINYIDPDTGQPALGTYNRVTHQVISQAGVVVPNAVPIIPSLLPSEHEGYTYQTDAAGNTIAIPVTTTTTKQLPGRPGISAPPPPPSASVSPEKGKKVGVMKPPQALMINPPATPGGSATAQAVRPGSKVNPQAVTAAGLSSANVPTPTVRTMAQRSQGQLVGIQQLDSEVDRLEKEGKLGPVSGRINDFMQGKIGEGDPEYSYLNNKIALLQTSMMLIHIGARSSPPILKKFEAMLDAGKMDGPTLKAGIRAVREQMEIYAKEGKIPGFGGPPKPPSGAPVVGTVEDGYRFKGGNAADPSSWEKVKK